VAGLAATLGSGSMTNSIAEIENAEVILVTGTNTTENHPVLSTFIKRAIRQNGAKLIVVDPRRIDLVDFAHLWLRQRSGTDIAWINGMLHVIFAEGLADEGFIKDRTENVDAVRNVVAHYTPEKVEEITGIPADDLVQAARLYAGSKASTILYAMGITQHSHGTDNVKSLANLAMATGQIGRASTGVNPLRGQNNVQGACDVGALPNVYTGYQAVGIPELQKKFESAWGMELPSKAGLTLVEMMHGIAEGKVKGMFILGENPRLSDPDSTHVEEALKKCEFLVVQDIFLTETAQLADVVLPAACFAEADGTFTNTERRVLRVRRAVEPPGEARPDLDILVDLSRRMGVKQSAATAKDVFDEIRTLTPAYAGITYDRIEGDGIQWPCPTEDHPGTPILHEGQFSRGLGLFTPIEHQEPLEKPTDEYPFTLTTGRVLYHYHTGSMTRRCEGIEALAPVCNAEIHPADAGELGIAEGDDVLLSSRRGEIVVRAQLTKRVPRKTVFVPFHYAEAIVNKLTLPALDPISKIPEFKVCAVQMKKAA
jgi:formate dehydrogenase alpha subunit